jgi:hypothetical protein
MLLLVMAISVISVPMVRAADATSSLHIIKYAEDGTKILAEKTVTYQWLEKNLPVQGDGATHYYHQGPVFEGDMWDPPETINLKDKGAVKGTDVKNLCELVGGMHPGDEVMIVAADGWHAEFAYSNIYEPLDRQGIIALCWYNGEDVGSGEGYGLGYPGNDAYNAAIQVVFMPKTKNAEGKYVFGNADMQVCLPQEKYQHFYEGFPSTNGLSGKWICEVRIYSGGVPKNLAVEKGQNPPINDNQWVSIALGALALALLGLGIYIVVRQKGFRTRRGKIDIKAISLLAAGILCVVASLVVYFYGANTSNRNITWYVTLISSNGEEKKLSYDDIIAMPGCEGHGGFFTTVGVINGPYKMRGVLLEDLCELIGGLTPSNAVLVSATDGYSAIFDYDQMHGDFATYDPETMKEVPHGELKLVLAYEQDGKILTQDCDKPLRLAIVGDRPLLTEGLHWVKWVNRIEIISLR